MAKYASLSTEEPTETNFTTTDPNTSRDPKVSYHRQHSVLRSWRTTIIAVSILLCGLLATAFIRSYDFSPHVNASSLGLHCGTSNTTAEARALGCEFDLMSYSWTPKQCFDEETASEFSEWVWDSGRQEGAFPFFYDVEGKNRVQDEHALSQSLGKVIHTTQEEHLGHCTFMIRRIHRVAESNGRLRLNSRYGKLAHSKHCSNEVLKSLQRPDLSYLGGIRSRFGVSFERC
ncbi:hypothetical protein G7Y89_g14708 [Cudoniella acicularis]|uniref:Uncharacterized protein n=1 Tax=Cudoniella acicularis TaxID=354080 RepID=A0A8H4VTV5_9HELO|nr:hypothetical protein G7Y89_g14708 [Cudoniella acicularis]